MATYAPKSSSAPKAVAGSTESRRIGAKILKLFHLPGSGPSDDPVCLSALDTSTLRRFGYNERAIMDMKEGNLR